MKISTEPIRTKLLSNEKAIEKPTKTIENQQQNTGIFMIFRIYDGIHPFILKIHYSVFLIKSKSTLLNVAHTRRNATLIPAMLF